MLHSERIYICSTMRHLIIIVCLLFTSSCQATIPPPFVEFTITPDKKSGYNIYIRTKNFKWTPENATSDHIDGEGHAHIYANNKKITRVYSPWLYLPKLPPGENKIKVTLSQNNHDEYVVKNKLISSTKIILVESEER
jgi:hypothetical protein